MLQQTQVRTVIHYFNRFIDRFPTINMLANASLDEVLELWAGLGYYRRARLLHSAARQVEADFNGQLPDQLDELISLPGIGRSTAGAILALGFDRHGVILDGNVQRVLARFHAVDGEIGRASVLRRLWSLAESHTPISQCANYTQAIMDLGATICTNTNITCCACPVQEACIACRTDSVTTYPMRARRTSPRREELDLLAVIDPQGRCLLQRQQESDLWGGLWLPLRLDSTTDPFDMLDSLGLKAISESTYRQLPSFTHTLSHIRFTVKPHVVRISESASSKVERQGLIWFDIHESPAIGLARLTQTVLELIQLEAEDASTQDFLTSKGR